MISVYDTPVDIVRSFYLAVAKGDPAAVIALLHPELAWTEAEGFPYYSGTWMRPEEVLEKLLVPLARDWDDFMVKADEFVSNGSVVVSFGAYSGQSKATGKAVRAPFAHRWECRDGKLQRFDMYTDTLLVSRALAGGDTQKG